MYIVTGSITSALRLSKNIQSYGGQPSSVVHTPAAIKKGGCSYSIKTDFDDTDTIKALAKEVGVSIRGIFAEKIKNGGRVFYDIS